MSSLESKTSSSTSDSTLTLQVKTLKGANFAITVPTNYTVAELQAQIARERDVPVDQQRIIYKGKVLKSDQTLASYGLEDGDNLHLIVRTPQQQQAAQQAIAADQASMSDVHAPGGAQPGANPQIQIFPAGENGMMIGSVDIQDHGTGMPDLNQIVNQVLNQMGVPGLGQSGNNPNAPTITFSTSPTIAFGGSMDMNGMMNSGGMMMGPGGMMSMGMGMPMMNATASTSTSSSASSSSSTSTSTSTSGTLPSSTSIPGFGGISHGGFASLNDLRLGMNQVADMITPSTSTTLTPIGRGVVDTPITTQTSNDVAMVFEQLHTLLSNITPRVADVVMSLRRQETLTGTARQQVTQQANDVGMALRRLSPMLHHVGRYGSGINLGTDPAHVTVVQAQPQVSVHVTSQPVITAVTSSQPFTTTTPFAFPTTATTSQMFGYTAPTTGTGTTPVTTASTSSTSTSTTSSTDTTTSQSASGQQAPVNMQQIMAQVGPMVGPIVSQLFAGAANAANAATTNNTGGAPANPLAAIMQAVGPAVQQVASSIQQGGAGAGAGAQGGNPLMAMIQNVMGSLAAQGANQPATTSAGVTATSTTTPATTTTTATPTATPAFTGSVTGSTSAPSATPASSSASTSTSTSSSTSSSTASPIDATSFAQLMSGMMGVLGQQAQQGATSGTSSSTATATTPATTSSTSSSSAAAPIATPVAAPAPIATPITSQPAAAANPLAGLLSGMGSGGMSGLMGMMSQIMGNAQGGRTIGDIIQSMGAGQQMEMEEDQDDDDDMEDEPRRRSPMEAIINRVITGLSMPDMMAMVSGNWAPLERQHATLRDTLLHDMMDDTDTPHARDSVAITLAMGFVNTLLNEQVLASVRDKMVPDKDLHTVSYPVVRQRCRELINIVIDTPISTSTTQGTPFATQLQSWSYLLVGSWMNVLAEGFTDGITSVDTVIKNAVQLKLSSISPEIGFMLPMVSGMLSSFILRAHQQYRANLISSDDGTGAQGWIQHVPENEQKHWITTIAMDEKVQAEQKETAIKEAQHLGITTARIQHPFSYSYSSGSAGAAKRRRLGGSTLREGEVQDEKESSSTSTSSSSTSSSASTLYSSSDLEGADLGAGLSRALKSAIDTVNQQVIKEETKNGRLNDEDVDQRKKENDKKAQEVIADLPSSNIQQLYRSQLIQDIRKRVRTDGDYNPAKFPKTSEHIDKA